MTRAAVYVRVSTEEQAMEGYSLEAQKDILLNYCEAYGFDVVAVYEDDGYSGRTTSRPAYRRMMYEMDSWDTIVVLKMDRIHRNSRNFMDMMSMLERNGRNFYSTTESLDTDTAMGRFVMDMIQRIGQLESEQIGERTYIGMKEKAETLTMDSEGKRTMGFNPPFGYRIAEGKLVDDPDELPVARLIFEDYLDGDTVDSICFRLNRAAILTRKGNPWNKYNLRAVLHNPVYAGYMRWEGILIRHDAEIAVSVDDFNAIQTRMLSRSRCEIDADKYTIHVD